MLTILFFEDVIAGRGDVAAPRALLHYVRDELESALPYDKDRLRARQVQIATAVDMVLETCRASGRRATRKPH